MCTFFNIKTPKKKRKNQETQNTQKIKSKTKTKNGRKNGMKNGMIKSARNTSVKTVNFRSDFSFRFSCFDVFDFLRSFTTQRQTTTRVTKKKGDRDRHWTAKTKPPKKKKNKKETYHSWTTHNTPHVDSVLIIAIVRLVESGELCLCTIVLGKVVLCKKKLKITLVHMLPTLSCSLPNGTTLYHKPNAFHWLDMTLSIFHQHY